MIGIDHILLSILQVYSPITAPEGQCSSPGERMALEDYINFQGWGGPVHFNNNKPVSDCKIMICHDERDPDKISSDFFNRMCDDGTCLLPVGLYEEDPVTKDLRLKKITTSCLRHQSRNCTRGKC